VSDLFDQDKQGDFDIQMWPLCAQGMLQQVVKWVSIMSIWISDSGGKFAFEYQTAK
jgi:hypothetical protein